MTFCHIALHDTAAHKNSHTLNSTYGN